MLPKVRLSGWYRFLGVRSSFHMQIRRVAVKPIASGIFFEYKLQ